MKQETLYGQCINFDQIFFCSDGSEISRTINHFKSFNKKNFCNLRAYFYTTDL